MLQFLRIAHGHALTAARALYSGFAILVEPPKTTFGKVRKTYSGKVGGEQDDACIALQLAVTGLRCACIDANPLPATLPAVLTFALPPNQVFTRMKSDAAVPTGHARELLLTADSRNRYERFRRTNKAMSA